MGLREMYVAYILRNIRTVYKVPCIADSKILATFIRIWIAKQLIKYKREFIIVILRSLLDIYLRAKFVEKQVYCQ